MEKAKVKEGRHGQGQIKLGPERVKGETEHANHFEQSQITLDGSLFVLQSKNQKEVDFRSESQNEADPRKRQASQVNAEEEHGEEGQRHVHVKEKEPENHSQDAELAASLVTSTAMRALELTLHVHHEQAIGQSGQDAQDQQSEVVDRVPLLRLVQDFLLFLEFLEALFERRVLCI